jgi:hypothetical protein
VEKESVNSTGAINSVGKNDLLQYDWYKNML